MIHKPLNQLKNFFRFPVFNYTLFGFLSLSLLIVGLTFASYKILINQKIRESTFVAESTSENVRHFIYEIVFKAISQVHSAEVEILNFSANKIKIDPLTKSKIYSEKLKNEEIYEIIAENDANGFYQANSEWIKHPEMQAKQMQSSLADREYFIKLKNNPNLKYVLSSPVKSRSTGNWVIVLAIRKFHPQNNFVGINLITISLKKLSEAFSKLNPNPDANITLYDGSNQMITRFPLIEENIGKTIKLRSELNSFENKITLISLCPIDNIDKVFGATKIEDLNLKALWGIPYSKVVSGVRSQYLFFGLIEIVIIFISLIFLYYKYINLLRLEALQINEVNNAKMILIGEFASGLAHEINNPLTIILGNAKSLLNKNGEEISKVDYQEKINKIIDTSERINKIIKSLKNLGHSPRGNQLERYSLSTVINDVVQIVNVNISDNNVDVHINIPNDLYINCIPSQISQVFLNLFSNSLYEIRKLEERWIKVDAEIVGNNVIIHFMDSGNGIPKDIRDKLMNSFYTTKPIGEGTGLGLTICKRIIKNQGGDIFINEKMKNTCFTIELPIS